MDVVNIGIDNYDGRRLCLVKLTLINVYLHCNIFKLQCLFFLLANLIFDEGGGIGFNIRTSMGSVLPIFTTFFTYLQIVKFAINTLIPFLPTLGQRKTSLIVFFHEKGERVQLSY